MTVAVESLQNGDVRLNLNDNGNQQEDHGVLEIYLNSVWVAVCVDNFNDGAAAAACRQLGYCDVAASGYRNATNFDPQDKRYISDVHCPSISNHLKNAELHLLRCLYGQVTARKCTPVFVNCDGNCLLKDIH